MATKETVANKIHLALQKAYSGYTDEVADIFLQVIDDQFDENEQSENILDDLNDTHEDSGIIDTMNEQLTWSDNELKKLFTTMVHVIRPPKPKAIIEEKSDFWDIHVSDQEQKEMEEFLTKTMGHVPWEQCGLKPMTATLRVIGIKNHISSLPTLLVDTLSRYRDLHFEDDDDTQAADILNKPRLKQIIPVKLRKNMQSYMDKFTDIKSLCPRLQYTAMAVIADRQCSHFHYLFAINRLIERLCKENGFPFQIDIWIIPSHGIQKGGASGGVPAKVIFADDDSPLPSDEEDSDDGGYGGGGGGGFGGGMFGGMFGGHRPDPDWGDDGIDIYGHLDAHRKNEYFGRLQVWEDKLFHIESRLKWAKMDYMACNIAMQQYSALTDEMIDKTSETMYKLLKKLMGTLGHASVSHKRYVIIIDKRVQSYKTVMSDRMLIYQPHIPVFGEIPMFDGGHIFPLYGLMSSSCYMIPNGGCDKSSFDYVNMKEKHIGAMQETIGHQNTYSHQIFGKDKIRVYWHINGGTTRWFPEYMSDLMPRFYLEGKTFENKQFKYSSKEIKKLWRFQYRDDTFDAFWKMMIENNQYIHKIPPEP